ncbi:Bug family tripartite tricarboxylate transporter substrate binding protein [Psychromarinibacter halotolerans]|uniref:Bug family tripartite tricarboxylate transporter substrate binding protein n=1 Tax=Psychromarinibacter halotolerans TaxID=1775175 RepID=A0ABV7GXS0_9RHOB|nr:tripartite tricarboxylate transporter substrate binding protein [Psychromarinibacter halotolerans]MDF0598487.1 tripartite tricarboxylate transporter substrate binding protein [Psychromarinibacter halotolerans]
MTNTSKGVTRRALLAFATAMAVVPGGAALAQSFPDQPITIVVAYAPGGGVDTAVRAMTDVMSEELGVSILVKNVGGGGGAVGNSEVSRADPDGYTILATNSSSITLEPQLNETMYDLDSFEVIAKAGQFQSAMITGADSSFSTFEELVAVAQEEDRPILLGSYLSYDRLLMGYMADSAGVEFTPVPVQGGNGAIQAMLSGDVDVVLSGGSWAPLVEAGDAKALFASSFDRLKMAPDLVSMKDLGFELGSASSMMFLAPAGTPAEIVDALAAAIEPAVASETAQTVGQRRNVDMTFYGPEEASQMMREELDAFAEFIEIANR